MTERAARPSGVDSRLCELCERERVYPPALICERCERYIRDCEATMGSDQ